MSAAELAGGFAVRDLRDIPAQVEEHFLRRLEGLPRETRRLLLVAAADPTGDVALLRQASQALGIGRVVATDDAGELVEIGVRVQFRHPLVRSAIYSGASSVDRRAVHLALAGAMDPQADPDRRAWHLALAAEGPDEGVASELERSASRAQSRGGLAASAAFLRRSVALTKETPLCVARALSAAQVSLHAGEFDSALSMVVVAEAGTIDETQLAHALLLRGQIAFTSGRWADAPSILMSAADKVQAVDLNLTRETYLDAWAAALYGGEAAADTLVAVSGAAMGLPPSENPRPSDMLLEGLATLITAGRIAAAPILRRAIAAFAAADTPVEQGLRWGWLAAVPVGVLWDEQASEAFGVRQVELARGAGALGVLPFSLMAVAVWAAMRGDFAAANLALAEAWAVTEATGAPFPGGGAMLLAALCGREAEATALFAAATGHGVAVQFARWVSAILFNSLGRYGQALVAALQASAEAPQLNVSGWALPELIEASARTDNAAIGQDALDRLGEVVTAADNDWARGVEARSRALMSDGAAAEASYREAIDVLDRTSMRTELARAYLLYGEWLRRQNRRTDAREKLRTAYEMFTEIGMLTFAARARHELGATGETVRKRREDNRNDLTPQEEQIARLAMDGRTNPEIGAQLFISARTVEWHLRKVFTKLGISSRRGLRDALPTQAGTSRGT
jgi:DNA-binding CsgD family transcriptional regulator